MTLQSSPLTTCLPRYVHKWYGRQVDCCKLGTGLKSQWKTFRLKKKKWSGRLESHSRTIIGFSMCAPHQRQPQRFSGSPIPSESPEPLETSRTLRAGETWGASIPRSLLRLMTWEATCITLRPQLSLTWLVRPRMQLFKRNLCLNRCDGEDRSPAHAFTWGLFSPPMIELKNEVKKIKK